MNAITKANKIKALKKLKFWNRILTIIFGGIFLIIISFFIFSDAQLESGAVAYPFLIVLFAVICAEIILFIGMAYHSYKQNKYIWFVAIILLGALFPIMFYLLNLRNELKCGRGIYEN